MVAAAYTDFGTLRAAYVFAYPRGADVTLSFQPKSLGFSGRVYVYNLFADAGETIDSTQLFTEPITGAFAYYIVTAIGESGIGLLGDVRQFVSLGRQRIPRITDNGVLQVAVAFAPGEKSRFIRGYAPEPPAVTAEKGTVGVPVYNPVTHRFSVIVLGDAEGSAVIDIVVRQLRPA